MEKTLTVPLIGAELRLPPNTDDVHYPVTVPSLQHALTHCVQEYGIPRQNAETEIRRINRNRIHHYEYYTGRKWGEPHHYNLMLNTGTIGLQTACQLIKGVYQQYSLQPASK